MSDNIELKKMTDYILNLLLAMDFTIQRYNAYSTNSIYLKLDFGVCNSIRISDHGGKPNLRYKYNIGTDIKTHKERDKGVTRYYYSTEDVDKMLYQIILDRDSKIQKFGMSNYKKYMRKNQTQHKYDKGFWRDAYFVKPSKGSNT